MEHDYKLYEVAHPGTWYMNSSSRVFVKTRGSFVTTSSAVKDNNNNNNNNNNNYVPLALLGLLVFLISAPDHAIVLVLRPALILVLLLVLRHVLLLVLRHVLLLVTSSCCFLFSFSSGCCCCCCHSSYFLVLRSGVALDVVIVLRTVFLRARLLLPARSSLCPSPPQRRVCSAIPCTLCYAAMCYAMRWCYATLRYGVIWFVCSRVSSWPWTGRVGNR